LTAKTWIWKGELYKEGAGTNNEWTNAAQATFSATSNSTYYFLLTAAPTQSFRDNANKLTNALRYNNTNGVSVTVASSTFLVVSSTSTYIQIDGLQLQGGTYASRIVSASAGQVIVTNCILYNGAVRGFVSCVNVNVLQDYTNSFWLSPGYTSNQYFRNCTIYGNGTSSAFATASSDTGFILKNCDIFGYTAVAATTSSFTGGSCNNNATNLSSVGFGSSNLVSLSATNQFQNIGSGTEDFRVKAGADLINAGVRDQTYTNDLDIVGQARSTTTPTIGAWEFSITYTYARPSSDITTQWTPSTGTSHFAMIDEVTASDADYISATAAGQTDEVKLQAMVAPQAGTSVAIGYRVQGITGSAGVTVSMVQGTTVIATDTTRTANGDYVLTVASGTWASVTDWTDIRLRFVSS
jgi:hypothetical protein